MLLFQVFALNYISGIFFQRKYCLFGGKFFRGRGISDRRFSATAKSTFEKKHSQSHLVAWDVRAALLRRSWAARAASRPQSCCTWRALLLVLRSLPNPALQQNTPASSGSGRVPVLHVFPSVPGTQESDKSVHAHPKPLLLPEQFTDLRSFLKSISTG